MDTPKGPSGADGAPNTERNLEVLRRFWEVFLVFMNCIFMKHFNSTAHQHSDDDHPDSRSSFFIIITLMIAMILAIDLL